MAKQLNSYIDSEGLSNINQSTFSFRRLHFTETALQKIQNDIAALMDSGKAVAFTLLAFPAAFNTLCLFIYLGFNVSFNTVQVISRRVVGRAEETSTYSSLGLCTVNCRPTASNDQLSHLSPCGDRTPASEVGGESNTICINHNILFNCLKGWFGVDNTVLRWIKSYLSNQKQKVKLGNSFSDAFSLSYGVPKGSVLVPLFFTLYTTPSVILFPVSMSPTTYVDETKIYLALNHTIRNFDSNFAELTECLTCVQKWMDDVKLKLNPEKIEFIIIGDRQAKESLIQKFPTQLLGNSISPINIVKNLGVTFDSGNTFTSHITKVCFTCYYHLKDLRCLANSSVWRPQPCLQTQ